MTGAPMPDGADAVVMVERTRADGDDVGRRGRPQPGEHVRARGRRRRGGRSRVRARARCSRPRTSVCSRASTCTRCVCHPRPRVGVVSTGDELVERGPLAPGRIRDSNRPMLLALARRGRLRSRSTAASSATTKRAITDGDRARGRHVRRAAHERRGVGRRLRLREARARAGRRSSAGGIVAVGAGRDQAGQAARVRDARRASPRSACPGNPVSSRVSFELFARPALRKLAGRTDIARRAGAWRPRRRRCGAGPTASCTSTGCGCASRTAATCASGPAPRRATCSRGWRAPTASRSSPTATASRPAPRSASARVPAYCGPPRAERRLDPRAVRRRVRRRRVATAQCRSARRDCMSASVTVPVCYRHVDDVVST